MDQAAPAKRTLNLEALRSFVAICETGSFRHAAASVHKSPSAISLQVAKLEEMLDARLLDRDARRVALTAQGEVLLRQARRLLGLSDETLAMFRASPLAGQLTLWAPHDLGISLVPNLLRRLAEHHPQIRVDVRLGSSDTVRENLADGAASIALFNDTGASSVAAREVFSEPLKWLMLNGGRAAETTPLPIATGDIESGCAWRDAALKALQAEERDYRVVYSSNTSTGQIAALRADLAVAALPQSLAGRELMEVPPEFGLPSLPLTFIRVADDGGELAQALVSLLVEETRLGVFAAA